MFPSASGADFISKLSDTEKISNHFHCWVNLMSILAFESCLLENDIRDLRKLRLRRQWQRQKTIGLVSKTTALHVHHAFLYISLPSLHDYDVK